MPSKKPTLSVVLKPEIASKLEKLAEKQGRSKSNLASWVLEQYIEGNLKEVEQG